ncbi:MAG: SAM-dependent methyltransferase [Nitrososphaerales archaeon]
MNTTDPFVPVPEDVIPEMLELASVRPGETVVDLGSGDGRIVIAAAKQFGAKAVGVEVREGLVRESRLRARDLGVSDRVKIIRTRFRNVGLRRADVLALYLSSYTLGLLAPKFKRELRKGSRIVTFDFPIFGWQPEAQASFTPRRWTKAHPIYLYVI